jgi:hypothetical protein
MVGRYVALQPSLPDPPRPRERLHLASRRGIGDEDVVSQGGDKAVGVGRGGGGDAKALIVEGETMTDG